MVLLTVMPLDRIVIDERNGCCCESRAEFAGGGGSVRWALILRRGLAAVVAASLLLVVPAVPAGAENDNPCQVYQDEVALQEARLEASPSWPRHYRDQARQDLQTCADRNPDRFAGPLNDANRNDPGKLLDEDGNRVAVVPAQPSASQVQSYTYSWLNSPYCGWTGNGVPKDCGRTQEEYDRLVERGAELYRPPIGGGPNGTVRVPCIGGQQVVVEPSSRRAVLDADGDFVTTGRPPAPGYSCY